MRYVLAIAEEQSFTRAAERCFVVQSSLSHQIKALEQELGLTLFARTSRRVELTEAGRAFLPAARASLEAAERAIVDASAASGQIRGRLSIGVIPTVTAIDIPAALRGFRLDHPNVQIHLHDGRSDEFITDIAVGAMDVAVLGLPDSTIVKDVATAVLARERLVAVVSAEHRLAGRRRLRLQDIADEAFVDFPAGSPGRAQSDLAFEAASVRRDVPFEAMSTDLMLDLVRNDLAVMLLAPAAVPADPAIRTVAVLGAPTRTEYLAWSRFNPSPAAHAFVELLAPGAADER